MESHPHLHLFDPARNWKYLIIGTFPPNTALREKLYINYFYGNKGFLWKIIHDIYHENGYDFFGGTMRENLGEIQRWQDDYCVGLSDTIESCSRKHPHSSDDADLMNIKYNTALKGYVLANVERMEKIIFTSTYGKNSAFENFRIIMGPELDMLKGKLVTGLPSPSGAANITFFNATTEETLGLTTDFFEFVSRFRPEYLKSFEERWRLKKLKRSLDSPQRETVAIPASPKGLVKEFKLWKYRQALPQSRCV